MGDFSFDRFSFLFTHHLSSRSSFDFPRSSHVVHDTSSFITSSHFLPFVLTYTFNSIHYSSSLANRLIRRSSSVHPSHLIISHLPRWRIVDIPNSDTAPAPERTADPGFLPRFLIHLNSVVVQRQLLVDLIVKRVGRRRDVERGYKGNQYLAMQTICQLSFYLLDSISSFISPSSLVEYLGRGELKRREDGEY